MIEKIFDALCENKLSVKNRLTGISMLYQYTLDRYTADDGKIYDKTYDCEMGVRDIHDMALAEVDNEVLHASFGNDLMLDLMLLANFSRMNWGASSAVVNYFNGVGVFEVKYDEEEFKGVFDYEESEHPHEYRF